MLVGDTVSGAGVAKDGKISLHLGSENKTTSYVINESQEEEGGGEGRGGGGGGRDMVPPYVFVLRRGRQRPRESRIAGYVLCLCWMWLISLIFEWSILSHFGCWWTPSADREEALTCVGGVSAVHPQPCTEVALTQISAYITHKDLALRKIMEAMRATYAKSGTCLNPS